MHVASQESKPLGKHIERYVEMTLSSMVYMRLFYLGATYKMVRGFTGRRGLHHYGRL
jgi:hypothetical protein